MALDIYAEELIRHYEHPSNKRRMKNANASMEKENVSCGDVVKAYLKIEGTKIEDASFEGNGCVISMATASMLTDYLKGKSVDHLESMRKDDVLRIISIDPGPVRMHCATLPLRAFKEAAFEYENKPIDAVTKEL
ncbi:MAG: iron-sulfur cluster assembly scaffold protein [Candidatus Micrarchaeales archaeon]|jgi:nitrogen fixation NifU-like protein